MLWLCFCYWLALLIPFAASDYGLEEESREYVSSVSLEGNGDADDYSYTEHQHEHISEAEIKQEETPLEEPLALPQNAVEASEEPEPSIHEPVREPSKLSYASIVCIQRAATSRFDFVFITWVTYKYCII